MTENLSERTLEVHDITAANFAAFGTLIEPMDDGTPFSELDATLDFSAGTPRFYAMKLIGRGTSFTRITRHRRVTQLLASVGGNEWAIAVAPPIDPENPDAAPELDDIVAFRVPGDVAIALHRATWHAGPCCRRASTSRSSTSNSQTRTWSTTRTSRSAPPTASRCRWLCEGQHGAGSTDESSADGAAPTRAAPTRAPPFRSTRA